MVDEASLDRVVSPKKTSQKGGSVMILLNEPAEGSGLKISGIFFLKLIHNVEVALKRPTDS
jgi:hypothetical protein